MPKTELRPALDPEEIYKKSQQYIRKAFDCIEADDKNDYQLWASLALELLGKACLAKRHPSLIGNKPHFHFLLAASGINKEKQITTVAASELYTRLGDVVEGFDSDAVEYCQKIAQKRNAELHSGEMPFAKTKLESWDEKYWYATQLILLDMGLGIEEWTGTDKAESPKHTVSRVRKAMIHFANVKLKNAREKFMKNLKKKAQRSKAIEESKTKKPFNHPNLFNFTPDKREMKECPSCGGFGVLALGLTSEEFLGEQFEDGKWMEQVEAEYHAQKFSCPVCQLHLTNHIELDACGMETATSDIEMHEREYSSPDAND